MVLVVVVVMWFLSVISTVVLVCAFVLVGSSNACAEAARGGRGGMCLCECKYFPEFRVHTHGLKTVGILSCFIYVLLHLLQNV